MSEGEFKKRLVFLKPQSDIEAMIGHALRVNVSTVEQVLDEAEAKIPSAFTGAMWYSDSDVQEMREWVRKYFGEKK